MSLPVAYQAPGKLMLCGEYAVLEGASAIVAAVDRFAVIGATADAVQQVQFRGPVAVAGSFRRDGAGLRWIGEVADVSALFDCVYANLPFEQAVSLVVYSTDLYDGGRKLGLGSSAAVTVALGQVFARIAGHIDVVASINAAHRQFQKGAGSGADIACSMAGGVIAFRRDVPVQQLDWPAGLYMAAIQQPVSASTMKRIARLRQWQAEAINAEGLMQVLAQTAEQTASCWRRGDATAIIDGLDSYTDQMTRIDAEAALGYVNADHARCLDAAREAGVSYKPCGAGGGDFGIAYSEDAEALAAFVPPVGEKVAIDIGRARPRWLDAASLGL
ncbi:MAG: hypothetical protein AAGA84_09555 [Pseudomonadota bacterium]